SFEMRVLAYDPYLPPEAAERLGFRLTDLEEVLREADFLSVHVPLTESNRNMIGAVQLATMKSGAYLINCARGGIIDEAALLRAVQDGRVAGAAVDVFTEEPATGNPLIAEDRILTTPHLGASTAEAQVNVAID